MGRTTGLERQLANCLYAMLVLKVALGASPRFVIDSVATTPAVYEIGLGANQVRDRVAVILVYILKGVLELYERRRFKISGVYCTMSLA